MSVLIAAVASLAVAQAPGGIPNTVPPNMRGELVGAPQVYPGNRGWPVRAQPVQTPQWPPPQVGRQVAPWAPGMQAAGQPTYAGGPFVPVQPQPIVFSPAETVALVGDQHIFLGDLVGDANLILAPFIEQMSPQEIATNRELIEIQRKQLVKRLLQGAIDRKLMYLEFRRSLPQDKDKLEEIQKTMRERISEAVVEQLTEMQQKIQAAKPEEQQELARQDNQMYRLASTMVQRGMTSPSQLDLYLQRYGSSLEKQTEIFAERVLGRQHLSESIETKPEVTHQEMVEYYRGELQEFQVPAQARWQQVTIRFDRVRNRREADERINEMGRELFFGGKQFWALAQQKSHGPNAQNGGHHDWTEWGDLSVSKKINEAVFTHPLNHLSRVIEDAEGFHIIRVLDRQDEHAIPFLEAQVDIKKKIESRKRGEALAAYIKRLREKTPVQHFQNPPSTQQRLAEPPRNGLNGYPR